MDSFDPLNRVLDEAGISVHDNRVSRCRGASSSVSGLRQSSFARLQRRRTNFKSGEDFACAYSIWL